MKQPGPDALQASGLRLALSNLSPRQGHFLAAGPILLVFLVGLALRVARLDFQPLWWDEGYSVWFATHPLGQMAALTAEDIHPPLYYALLRGWTLLLGTGPVSLRLLSVLFGSLAIPAIYLAGQRLFGGSRVPLLAAALLAINPLHVFYSQEVRMYGLVALLSTGAIAAAWRMFDTETRGHGDTERFAVSPRPRHVCRGVPGMYAAASLRHLVTYILLTTAALYTQYYAAFLPIGLTLYALWRFRRGRDGRALARWLAAQAAIALLYLPWALYAAPRLIPYVSQKVVADADRPLSLATYAARHLAAFAAGHLEGPLAPWWPAGLLLLVPVAVGLWLLLFRPHPAPHDAPHNTQYVVRSTQYAAPEAPAASAMLAAVLFTALILGWLISRRAPFFPERGERLLILALPAAVLLAAGGLEALWRRWRAAGYLALALGVAASAASLAAFYSVPRYAEDDYRPLIARASEQGLPGDTVFAVYPWQAGYWRSYGSAGGPIALLSPSAEWDADVAAALDAALDRGRVWFPAHLALGAILETEIEAHLASRATPFVNEWHGPNTRLSAWASTSAKAVDFTAETSIRFVMPGGEALLLRSASGSTEPVPAANAVTPIVLAWEASGHPPVLNVSVRLTDDLGQIWAQHDYEPLGGVGDSRPTVAQNDNPGKWSATDRLGVLVPAGTPPGRYRVELVLRPKGSQRPLDAVGPEGRVLGPAAHIFDLAIIPADRELAPERLPIAAPRAVDLAGGLRFLGHSTDEAALVPGELRKVSLFWQAAYQPATDAVAFVQVLGRDGAPVALWEAPPGAAYPTSAWTPGTLMRTQASFRVPASVPDGRYRLIAGLFRADDKARLRTAAGAEHILLGAVTVRGRRHQMTPPQPQWPADAVCGSVARLVGYDLTAVEAEAGEVLNLTLHWQALAATERPYTVFVHLADGAGAVRGYGDAEPGGGAFPTPGWLAGEYLLDTHTVTIAADAAAGTYRLLVGFYDPASGERLKTPSGADHVALETPITVR